ncbi:MAG: hypothetical protein A3G41_07430 [Elusimicrobia bacterium RIFCSPLOWO2_12_FULL_59_9]|nr:MAG: hypothetical protein A3G41_07430 [Elusimicrobia bacterium RIFCSPLOWO2_12_FULL_59_9]
MTTLIYHWQIYLACILIALVISLVCTPLMRFVATHLKVLDTPSSEIKTHKHATPSWGGVAVFAAFASSLLIIRFWTHFPTGTLNSLRAILLGGTIVLILGIIDDLKKPNGLTIRSKFLFQTLAALLLIYYDIRIQFVQPVYLAYFLTALWVVGLTNALNIIDIMDGLCASQAIVCGLAFLIIAIPSELIYVNFAAAALVGAALGFLPYNIGPQQHKIFLGDSGSMLIGFVLAALSLGTSYSHFNDLAVFAPIFILSIPLYDTFFVMTIRLLNNKSPFMGSKDHFALRLEALGLERRHIVFTAAAVSALLSALAAMLPYVNLVWSVWIYIIIGGEFLLFSLALAKIKMH